MITHVGEGACTCFREGVRPAIARCINASRGLSAMAELIVYRSAVVQQVVGSAQQSVSRGGDRALVGGRRLQHARSAAARHHAEPAELHRCRRGGRRRRCPVGGGGRAGTLPPAAGGRSDPGPHSGRHHADHPGVRRRLRTRRGREEQNATTSELATISSSCGGYTATFGLDSTAVAIACRSTTLWSATGAGADTTDTANAVPLFGHF